MSTIVWATPLYEFLRHCQNMPIDRSVLDCGAGGTDPPLQLFHEHGFATCGVDIQAEAVAQAQAFCRQRGMALNIIHGDMRHLPFAAASFGCVYSFNAIFFMTKPDVALSIREMERVLKPGGLCYVNFKSTDTPDDQPFQENSYPRRLLGSTRFSHHTEAEADAHFGAFVVLRKLRSIEDKRVHDAVVRQTHIEYIVRKP